MCPARFYQFSLNELNFYHRYFAYLKIHDINWKLAIFFNAVSQIELQIKVGDQQKICRDSKVPYICILYVYMQNLIYKYFLNIIISYSISCYSSELNVLIRLGNYFFTCFFNIYFYNYQAFWVLRVHLLFNLFNCGSICDHLLFNLQ